MILRQSPGQATSPSRRPAGPHRPTTTRHPTTPHRLRSREDEKNYGPTAALQKDVMAKRPDNLNWYDEQNAKEMVDEVSDFYREEKDDSLMDPANFPDVKAVAAELDKLRAEYKR